MKKQKFTRSVLMVIGIFSQTTFSQNVQPSLSPVSPVADPIFSESKTYIPRLFDYEKNPKPISLAEFKSGSLTGEMTIPISVFGADDIPKSNLIKDDFKVLVGGKEQIVSSVGNKQVDVVLVFDVSPSTDSRINQMKGLANEIVKGLKSDSSVKVLQFCSELKVLGEFTSDRKAITSAISKAKMGEGTSIYNAVSEIFKKHLNNAVRPVSIILFTDGVDSTSRKSTFMGSLVDAEKRTASIYPVFFDTIDVQQKNSLSNPAVSKEERQIGLNYLNDLISMSGGRGLSFDPKSPQSSLVPTRVALWLNSEYFATVRLSLKSNSEKRLSIQVRVNQPNLRVFTKGSFINSED